MQILHNTSAQNRGEICYDLPEVRVRGCLGSYPANRLLACPSSTNTGRDKLFGYARKHVSVVPSELVCPLYFVQIPVKSERKTELFTVILRQSKRRGKIHLSGRLTLVAILSFSLGTAGGFLYADLQKK